MASCVSYSRYEATALVAEKYRALAQARRDSIEYMYWDHLQTHRENEALAHDKRLLNTELYTTRTQYAQLQVANADVVSRYDRSLALSTFENEATFSARHRLQQNALSREGDARRERERAEEMAALVEDLTEDKADLESLLVEYEGHAPAVRRPAAASLATPEGLLTLDHLRPLRQYGTSEVTTRKQDGHYVVRVSESLCFAPGGTSLSGVGRAVFGDLGGVLLAHPGMEVLVHADSRREGTHEQIVDLERQQANAVVDALARRGLSPRVLHALDDAEWAGRVGAEGTVARGFTGEVIVLLRPLTGPGLSAVTEGR